MPTVQVIFSWIDKVILQGDRGFPGKRWVRITLRTLHLIGIAGLGGVYLYGVPLETALIYLLLTTSSGLILMFIEIWSHGIWLIQLRGLAILIKIPLFALIKIHSYDMTLFLLIMVISGIIAHAPASIRYFSIFHGTRKDSW